MGDKPITHVSQDDANHFVDTVQQLPPNRSKVAAYRGKPLDEVLKIRKSLEEAENRRRKLNTDKPYIPADFTMSPRTVDKHISILGTFFKWAIGKGYVHGKNVFEGQKIQTASQREEDTQAAREPFTDADLQKIFSAENYQTRKTAHDFWCPLIGLFSGLRLNEIAQLYVTDIAEVNGVWTFNINKNAPDKSLKNKTARRLVPVQPQLLALGFLDFIEDVKKSGKPRVFSQLDYVEGSYGRKPGRNFADYLTAIGIPEKEKVFHSFRHTFNNNLKQVPFALGLDLAGLHATRCSIWQGIGGNGELLVQFRKQLFSFCRRVGCSRRKIEVPRVARTVIADGHQEASLHDHLGLQVLRPSDGFENDVHRLTEPSLIPWGLCHPCLNVYFVQGSPPSGNPSASKEGTLIESFHASE
jgi:integrase